MQVTGDIDKEPGLKKDIPKPPFKQTCIVGTIMILSFLSEASDDVKVQSYIDITVAAVLFCFLAILTEYKGRKPLFITLSIVSIVSSTALLPVEFPEIGNVLQMAIRGATVALTGVALCEYSEPRHRLTHLIVNSAILRVSYWAIPSYDLRLGAFDTYFQIAKIALGLLCLASVLTWPESPYWLASKRRFEEAKTAFSLVRSGDPKSSELETLIHAQDQRGSMKMIYVPLLIGLPVVLVYSTIIYDFENSFYNRTANFNETWFYLVLNVVITGISVLIAQKVSRRVLISVPTATCTVSVIAIILWKKDLINHLSSLVNLFVTDFSYLLLYPFTLCAITSFNYPIAIESISCKYSNFLSGILGVIYFATLPLCIEIVDMRIMLAFIVLCLLLNPIIAYLLLPEAKDKSLIEIEQAYLPKEVERGNI